MGLGIMAQRKFYNPELDTTERYTEVWKIELVQVRDESNLMVRNHYWKDSDGELWVDFNNPMENVTRSFAAYRSKKGYMTPEDIRKLRHNLGLTVRQFAKRLGIAPSSLTQIENNLRVQVICLRLQKPSMRRMAIFQEIVHQTKTVLLISN